MWRDQSPVLLRLVGDVNESETLPARVVERAYERDPLSARAEYDAEFRTDVAAFLDLAIIEAAVDHGVTVRRPVPEEGSRRPT